MQDSELLPFSIRGTRKLTVCPCCGFKFEGDLRAGCTSCGARAVGEPLARPEHELPAYGRALLVGAMGALMYVAFLASTIAALLERTPFSLDFWSTVAAAETAAWRLKWFALPLTVIALWGGKFIYASIRREPARFAGQRIAFHGLMASALVATMIATFIGVTVPERLRQRRRAIEAAENAKLLTIDRALLEYRTRYRTLPTNPDRLRLLPDPDGSIAAVLAEMHPNSYRPSSLQAASRPEAKSRTLRGAALRRISTNDDFDDLPEEGFSFTNYELVLPGEDKVFGTIDDRRIRDGVITKPTQSTQQNPSISSLSDATAP